MASSTLDDLVEKVRDLERAEEIRAIIRKTREEISECGAQIYHLRAVIRNREREQREAAKARTPTVRKSLTRRDDADRFYRIATALINRDAIDLLKMFGREETRAGRLQPAIQGL